MTAQPNDAEQMTRQCLVETAFRFGCLVEMAVVLAADGCFNFKPVFFYLRLQGGTGETQDLGSPGSIAAREVEGFADENAGSVVHHGVEKTLSVTLGQLLSEQLPEGFAH